MARRWKNSLGWILLACVALTAAMAAYTYGFERDRYLAVYSLYALPADAGTDATALERSRMLARDCARLTDTEAFRAEVLSRFVTDGTGHVQVAGVDGTHIIEVRATDESAENARELANAVGETLVLRAADTLGAAQARELERAALPQAPDSPKRVWKLALTALILFAALSLVGGLCGSNRETARFHRSRAARQAVPCLGGLPDERPAVKRWQRMLRHRKDAALYDSAGEMMIEALRSLLMSLRAACKPGEPCAVALAPADGFDGAETLALLMASALAEQRRHVLLVDMTGDGRALGEMLDARGGRDLVDCLSGGAMPGEAVVTTPIPNLFFIDGLHGTDDMSRALASPMLARFVASMRSSFDAVLLLARDASAFADAGMAGAAADCTLLLAADGQIDARRLGDTVARLETLTDKPVGVAYARVSAKRLSL